MNLTRLKALALTALLCPALSGHAAAQPLHCAGHYPPSPAATAKSALSALSASLLPSRGQIGVLVVFAGFSNEVQAGDPAPTFADALFDPDLPGSFAHFYHTMSQGLLSVDALVLPRRYAAAGPAISYLATEEGDYGGYGQFVIDVLRQVDQDVDFSQLDNNGPDGIPDSGDDDGLVDYIFVNILSTPRNFIIQGATGIVGLGFDQFYTNDVSRLDGPIRISGSRAHGALQGEGRNLAQAAGSMAHEFGHSLGLPDLYDTSFLRNQDQDPAKDSGGIGHWGLMGWGAHGWNGDDGPNSFSPWSLAQLGWIGIDNENLVTIAADTTGLLLRDLYQGGSIYKIRLGIDALNTYETWPDVYMVQEEYLLLEYRSPTAHHYRRHIPGEGLLIWHISPRSSLNDEETDKRVDLVCADGLYADAGFPLGQRPAERGGGDNLDFWAHDAEYTHHHGGNLGDATDLFDGRRRAHFNPTANPSSSILSTASTGVVVENMAPLQGAMQIDIRTPRWAGLLSEEIHWSGEIRLDGDLTVGPQGQLTLLENTQVLVAGADIGQGGRDPDRCEILVQGDLTVRLSYPFHRSYANYGTDFDSWYVMTGENPTPPLFFSAAEPGQTWYGILLDPAPNSRILLPQRGLELNDALHGLVMPRAPTGEQGLSLSHYQLVDGGAVETAEPTPGENFHLIIGLANWSLASYENVHAELSWNSPLVNTPSAASTQRVSSVDFSIYPGCQTNLKLPALKLQPEAKIGDRLDFTLQVRGKGYLWTDSLALKIGSRQGEGIITAVTQFPSEAPQQNWLGPPAPNPFNGRSAFAFHLPRQQYVQLTLFNLAGQRVKTLVDQVHPAGRYRATWDGRDAKGQELGSGLYFVQMRAGSTRLVRPLTLIK
ncbi:MAG: hypothetical protein GKR89_11490 [Candidatus Latescibacteria bacterium]|nr:hypothetical protein [Candidatus Latescibacterota bacterium]